MLIGKTAFMRRIQGSTVLPTATFSRAMEMDCLAKGLYRFSATIGMPGWAFLMQSKMPVKFLANWVAMVLTVVASKPAPVTWPSSAWYMAVVCPEALPLSSRSRSLEPMESTMASARRIASSQVPACSAASISPEVWPTMAWLSRVAPTAAAVRAA